MLLGISGGICAGSSTVAEYLILAHGFRKVAVIPNENSPLTTSIREWRKSHGLQEWYEAQATQDISNGNIRSFPTVDALLEYVTQHWQSRWVVTTDLWTEKDIQTLQHRPAFLHITIDAPTNIRYQRLSTKSTELQIPTPDLLDFIAYDEKMRFAPSIGLAPLSQDAQLKLINISTSLPTLYNSLRLLDLPSEERLRPSWDSYFMQLADLAAQRSNCMKRRVGCVLAHSKRVITTGYNGTPRGMTNCNQGGCPRCNNPSSTNKAGAALDTCLCLHAEENALLEAGRERIRDGSILYCNTCPCLTCSVKIAQVGISEVVYSTGYHVDSAAAAIFAEAGVKLRQFSPPREGVVYLDTAAETESLLS